MPRVVLLILCALLIGQPASADAGQGGSSEPAANFIQTASHDVLALLNGPGALRDADLKALLKSTVDLKVVGQFVLEGHWYAATDGQRKEYLGLFSDYVLEGLVRILKADPVHNISIVGCDCAAGADAVVRTRVQRGQASSFDWAWQVRRTGQGYQAVDLITGGISLAKTLQSEFGGFVGARGIEALLEILRSKNS